MATLKISTEFLGKFNTQEFIDELNTKLSDQVAISAEIGQNGKPTEITVFASKAIDPEAVTQAVADHDPDLTDSETIASGKETELGDQILSLLDSSNFLDQIKTKLGIGK